KLFTKEIFLEYIDYETAEEIIGTYIEGDNHKPKYNYYDFENIKTKTLKLFTGYKTCYFINDWEYSDLEEFALDREDEGLMSSHYDYNHDGYDKVIANPTYIKKLHVEKNVKEMFLYNFVVSEIYYDGTLNDWVKIQKNGFQYIRDKLFNKPQFYELYILDYDGDIEFYGNRYSKVENIVIDKSEIITSHSFYSMKGIKTVNLKGVKIVEKDAFDYTDLEEFYITSEIEVFNSNVNSLNIINYNDCIYVGDSKKKCIVLLDYNSNNPEFVVDNECKVIRGTIKNKESIKKITLDNTKIVDIPKEYFNNCVNVKEVSLPKTIKTIGWCAFTNNNIEYLYFDGSIEEFNKIIIDSIGYDPITERPEDVGSSPLKDNTKLYLLDDNGDVIHNDKKYKLYK
ncbi:MAG: leucine-rich repeat domain-containing protein, partial [Acholeplasmatales bacterium]|nr:leucine-rich repeat domain-containing protein [Acholeplasmatales bacterium]